jgi:hypothetical protein
MLLRLTTVTGQRVLRTSQCDDAALATAVVVLRFAQDARLISLPSVPIDAGVVSSKMPEEMPPPPAIVVRRKVIDAPPLTAPTVATSPVSVMPPARSDVPTTPEIPATVSLRTPDSPSPQAPRSPRLAEPAEPVLDAKSPSPVITREPAPAFTPPPLVSAPLKPIAVSLWFQAGVGAGLPASSTTVAQFLASLDVSARLAQRWRVGVSGAFGTGSTLRILDEALLVRGELTSRNVLCCPMPWCVAIPR